MVRGRTVLSHPFQQAISPAFSARRPTRTASKGGRTSTQGCESAWGFGVSGFGWECEGVIGASGYEGAAASWRVVCAMCCRCGTTVLR